MVDNAAAVRRRGEKETSSAHPVRAYKRQVSSSLTSSPSFRSLSSARRPSLNIPYTIPSSSRNHVTSGASCLRPTSFIMSASYATSLTPERAKQLFDLFHPDDKNRLVCPGKIPMNIRCRHPIGKEKVWILNGELTVLLRRDAVPVAARSKEIKAVADAALCRHHEKQLEAVATAWEEVLETHGFGLWPAAAASRPCPARRASFSEPARSICRISVVNSASAMVPPSLSMPHGLPAQGSMMAHHVPASDQVLPMRQAAITEQGGSSIGAIFPRDPSA